LGAVIFDLFDFYKSNGIEDKFNMSLVKDWGIVPTKEGGFQFFPGLVDGEGFFFALLQKPISKNENESASKNENLANLANERYHKKSGNYAKFQKPSTKNRGNKENSGSKEISDYKVPDHEYALSLDYAGEWPSVELSKSDALQYLSRNTIILHDAPMGYLRVTYNGLGLGFVKNLGTRANNLYPMNWRIRMDIGTELGAELGTHIV